MYREILTSWEKRQVEKEKIKFKCKSCGNVESRPEFCPITGQPAGSGYEHTCIVCRGPLVRLLVK